MKKLFIALLLAIPMFLVGTAVSSSATQSSLEIRLVSTEGISLKEAPTRSSETIRTLKKGEALKLTNEVIAGWRKVQLDAYTYAYVNNTYLRQVAGYTVDMPAYGEMRLAASDTTFKTEPKQLNVSMKQNDIIVQRSKTTKSVLIETLSGHKGYVPTSQLTVLPR